MEDRSSIDLHIYNIGHNYFMIHIVTMLCKFCELLLIQLLVKCGVFLFCNSIILQILQIKQTDEVSTYKLY